MTMTEKLTYMTGFGNEHSTEAIPGALPIGQNSPQQPPFGLYSELLSGTAFTAPRSQNRRTWFYRIRPSVKSRLATQPIDSGHVCTAPDQTGQPAVTALRWNPPDFSNEKREFLAGWKTMATSGSAMLQRGMAAHIYTCNQSMDRRYMQNVDGELLVVPQTGSLRFRTEAGMLEINPGEICVIPKGYKFAVDVLDGDSRGYICENYGSHLQLPELGPIGSNGLANARDFKYPVAAYEEGDKACELVVKANGQLFISSLESSPLDVVAWHGNLAPYKYDLTRFNVMGSISFDHPDPSIYTVLHSPSGIPGTANLDFVIFPPRWLVSENTFRPPWFHSNVMSEFMGLIYGQYDSKPEGFLPGGSSLHNSMVPHGPDEEAFTNGTNKALEPEKLDQTMAFMFESRYCFTTTELAMTTGTLQTDYADCWRSLKSRFDPAQ